MRVDYEKARNKRVISRELQPATPNGEHQQQKSWNFSIHLITLCSSYMEIYPSWHEWFVFVILADISFVLGPILFCCCLVVLVFHCWLNKRRQAGHIIYRKWYFYTVFLLLMPLFVCFSADPPSFNAKILKAFGWGENSRPLMFQYYVWLNLIS